MLLIIRFGDGDFLTNSIVLKIYMSYHNSLCVGYTNFV